MFDTEITPIVHQRARGIASVGLASRGGVTRLRDLRQEGCAKAFLPRVESGSPEVVFLNTAGGLTGGDRLDFRVDLGAGARATVTTQTAERAYARPTGAAAADMRVRLDVGTGAHLDWLPQETILYDACGLERDTQIALAGDARVLLCETLVLGRAAMNERVDRISLVDRRTVTRDGKPVVIDAVQIGDDAMARRHNPAGLRGARAVGLLALVAPGAESAADGLRDDMAGLTGVTAAISAWDGRCIVRLMADDGWPLRVALAALIRRLRGGEHALPRVWQI